MIKEWFLSANQRDKIFLSIGLCLLLALIFWIALWKPLIAKKIKINTSIDNNYETLISLQKLQNLPVIRINERLLQEINQSLVLLVDQSHRSYNLEGTLIRNQPENENKIRLTFENASFNNLLSWLLSLNTTYGIIVESINLDNSSQSGLVNSSLVLAKP
ncbi:MAG: hypothetical protein CBC38_00490 [Gammaproteobacteria bacterium TMED78]|nr:MAG: hypothetical protein CBC38_00490 [Gammaproteobacteria bacterium TMED78]